MASRPSTVPQLDTNQTYRTIPSPSKVTDGYLFEDPLPAANVNYLWGWAGDWLAWLDERSADGAVPATDLYLQGVDTVDGLGGRVRISGGSPVSSGTWSGGEVRLAGGTPTVDGNGGWVVLDGGDAGGAGFGGSIQFSGGTSATGDGGDILFYPGLGGASNGGVSVNDAKYWADFEIHPHANGAVDLALMGDNSSTSYTEIGFMSENSGSYYAEWYTGAMGYQHATYPGEFFIMHYRNIAGTPVQKRVIRIDDSDIISMHGTPLWADVEIHPRASGTIDLALIGDNSSTSYTEIGFMSENSGSYYAEWYLGSRGYQKSANPGEFFLVHNRNVAGTPGYKEVLKIEDNDTVRWVTDAMSINRDGGVQTDLSLWCDNSSGAYNEIGFLSQNGASTYSSWWVGAQGYQASVNPGTFFIFHGKNIAGGTPNSTPFYIGDDDKIGMGGVTTPLGTVHIQSSVVSGASVTYDDLVIEANGWAGATIVCPTASGAAYAFANQTGPYKAALEWDSNNDQLYLFHSSGNYFNINSTGISFNTTGPLGTCHIKTGAAGGSVTPDVGADDLILENSTYGGMTIITPATSGGSTIAFAYAGTPLAGQIYFSNDDDKLYALAGSHYFVATNTGTFGFDKETPDTLVHLYGTPAEITYEVSSGDKYLAGNNTGSWRIRNVTDTRTDFSISGTGSITCGAIAATAIVSGEDGLAGTGNGAGDGVVGTGGSTNGSIGVVGTSNATNGVGVKGTGSGTSLTTSFGVHGVSQSVPGVAAESDTTSPVRGSLHLVGQNATPTTSIPGDMCYNSTTGNFMICTLAGWKVIAVV
jgi:hypothetical protein